MQLIPLRLEDKVDWLAVVLEGRQVVAVRKEVRVYSFLKNSFEITHFSEFAHGLVDPIEAGRKGGQS